MKRQPSTKDIELCLYCPTLCESRCPVNLATGNVTWSPWGKMAAGWRIRSALVPSSQESGLPVSMCLDCLACREACDHLTNIPENLTAMRSELAARGQAPESLKPGNGSLQERRERLAGIAPAWRQTEDCAALLVPGAEMLGEGTRACLKSLFAALDRLGDQTLGVNQDSVLDCGHLLAASGDLHGAKAQATATRGRWSRYNRIVLASPHDLSFVRLQWASMELDPPKGTVSVLDHLSGLLDYGISPTVASKVAYLDSCHLGRHLGIFELPRDLIKWAIKAPLVELLHQGRQGTCCGGGYPLSWAAPEVGAEVAGLVMQEFRASGAEVLVSACARCVEWLQQADPDFPVYFIAQLLSGEIP